jgi:hypothetical protein
MGNGSLGQLVLHANQLQSMLQIDFYESLFDLNELL